MIKILYVNQHIENKQNGGDMVQMYNTKEYLEKNYDVKIVLCNSLDDEELFFETDIVHIFNMQTIDYSLLALKKAKKYNKKVVLSTIFWDLRDASYVNTIYKMFGILPNRIVKNLKVIGDNLNKIAYKCSKKKYNIMFNKKKYAQELIMYSDCLLPNSYEELDIIGKFYKCDKEVLKKKSIVVPNAINNDAIKQASDSLCEIDEKNYVLQVGAINSIKNQISLVKALYDKPEIRIVFIGKCGDEKYYNELKKISNKRGNVRIISELDNSEVLKYYKNALCHVLPSFRESPGLVSLEAASFGIPIVVSSEKYCPIHYYGFDEYAEICDPYDVKSIREAVLASIKKGRGNFENEFLNEKFIYEIAANETYKAYCNAVI